MDSSFNGAEEIIESPEYLEKAFWEIAISIEWMKIQFGKLMILVNGTEISIFWINRETNHFDEKWDSFSNELGYMLKKSEDPENGLKGVTLLGNHSCENYGNQLKHALKHGKLAISLTL